MHRASYDGVTFNFNSDFSGNLIITRGGKEFEIPASAILKLAAYNYVAENKIREIESTGWKQLLGNREDVE